MNRTWALRLRLDMLVVSSLLALLAACGGTGSTGNNEVATGDAPGRPVEDARDFDVSFTRGPIPFAVEAALELTQPEPIESVTFTVHTKPGNAAEDVEVTYARSYLVREGLLDEALGEIRFTVFGLYIDHDNEVTVRVDFPTATAIARPYVVNTVNDPPLELLQPLFVNAVEPGLGLNFMSLQRVRGPMIVDIDGEIRWATAPGADPGFAFMAGPEGIVLGSQNTGSIVRIDWLGRATPSAMSDPFCVSSHHNIEPGKTGLLNTVSFDDGVRMHPESVLAEMTETGEITRLWEFDRIFADHITANGEDPSTFVQNSVDWFHMNSAIYDASDDSIIASSRENFIVKVDYATGAIKWILGNPSKLWYTNFPNSLQPLALTVTGTPPIGQHSLSISADGTLLTCFNNGRGNVVLPDVGDDLGRSTASVYRIDANARTAEEILSLDAGLPFSPFCSSAYRTAAGHMLATFSMPVDGSPPRICVIDDANQILFDAMVAAQGCGGDGVYAAREMTLNGMLIE